MCFVADPGGVEIGDMPFDKVVRSIGSRRRLIAINTANQEHYWVVDLGVEKSGKDPNVARHPGVSFDVLNIDREQFFRQIEPSNMNSPEAYFAGSKDF